MRVEVDRARCEGHGMCEDACPEVFRLDDDGELEILMDRIPDELRRKAESAVRLCPVAALTVRTD
ncbi:ferredoxin [Solirubrobacter ginsenosidimutans]|uniref:Ferredoxin n=1 Tax=Solirubrobacter ginsenosidimutans TaxID=490573 RepID=A0A9X3MSX5_9ACTN|nr:ferredoxin [Solirubrobacter ginsenosidimutans]MDA0159068.1 ferredoxin [Solirubrobacter ginsenosidimutans]